MWVQRVSSYYGQCYLAEAPEGSIEALCHAGSPLMAIRRKSVRVPKRASFTRNEKPFGDGGNGDSDGGTRVLLASLRG